MTDELLPEQPPAAAPEPAPEQRPRRGRIDPIRLGAMASVLVATLLLGWFWSPFGRPQGEIDLPPAATGDASVPLAALQAGSCLAEFGSAWDPHFTVVDCAAPHPAEQYAVVPVAGQFPAAPDTWPGEDALRDRAMLACQDTAVLDLDTAATIPGLRIEVRWPASEQEWNAGVRDYRCFAVGENLTGSLAR